MFLSITQWRYSKCLEQKNLRTTLLSLFLAFVFIFSSLPTGLIANAEEPETPSVEPETEVVDALYEKTELRTVDTKYIQMSDDTVQALVYGSAIHRKDAEGVWQDIDNSLTETEGAVYSDRVSFTKKIGEDGVLFALEDGDYKITLSLPDADGEAVFCLFQANAVCSSHSLHFKRQNTAEKDTCEVFFSR